MMRVWKAQKKPIVIGMRLDDREDLFLHSAMSLAKRLQSSVELVHCLESSISFSSAGGILPKASSESSAAIHARTEDRIKDTLMALAQATDSTLETHVHVERGDPAENLMRIAKDGAAGLIVCGVRDQAQPQAFKGLSTALSLAFYAPVPVLILPLTTAIDFAEPLNVVIADSLGGEGWHVLESGLQLARTLDCGAIHHGHVLKAHPLDILSTLRDMRESARLEITPEHLEKDLLEKIKNELFYRFHNSSCSRDLLGRYQPVAAIGDIDSEWNRIMASSKARLVIMGRHQFYSNRRLMLDHIPYRAIMEQSAGLLVIPNYEEAWNRLQENEWESRSNADKDLSEMAQIRSGWARNF